MNWTNDYCDRPYGYYCVIKCIVRDTLVVLDIGMDMSVASLLNSTPLMVLRWCRSSLNKTQMYLFIGFKSIAENKFTSLTWCLWCSLYGGKKMTDYFLLQRN